MPETRRWGLVTAVGAPLALIGGWTLAAALRPGFDSTRETISALAERGAPHRWVMTTAFVLLGLCHLGTAAALRPARLPGRLLLGVGGLLTLGVAAYPLPTATHGRVATGAFLALNLWPLLALSASHLVLRARVAVPAVVVLGALLVWFASQLDGPLEGLSERFAAGAQALWPLVVVLLTVRRRPAVPARP